MSSTDSTEVLLENVIFVNNGDAVGNGIQAGAADGTGTPPKRLLIRFKGELQRS